MHVRLRDLSVGAQFKTLLTRRIGRVLDQSEEGTLVRFEDRASFPLLHPEVRVEAEAVVH